MGTILLGLFSLANILLMSSCNPLASNSGDCKNQTMYDAIFKECPSVDKLFNNASYVQKCQNWCTIKDTKLTKETESEALCLMYYKSFTSVCKHSKAPLIIETVVLNNYTTNVCNLNITSAKLDSMLSVFGNETQKCKMLCYEYDNSVEPVCQLIHYYISLNLNMTNKAPTESILLHNPIASEPRLVMKDIKNETAKAPIPQKEEKKPEPDDSIVKMLVPQKQEKQPKAENSNPNAPISHEQEEKPDPVIKDKESGQTPIVDNTNSEKVSKSSTDHTNSNVGVGSPVTSENIIPEITQGDEPDAQGLNEAEKESPNDNNDSRIDEEDDQGALNYEDSKPVPIAPQEKKEKPETLDGEPASYSNTSDMDGESYFFFYFMVVCVLFVLGYVGYHNRQKVLALVLEGKRGKRSYRRRPNSANYHKLDSNLEEAMSSACTKNSSHVIY